MIKILKFYWQFIRPHKWLWILVISASFISPVLRIGFDYFAKIIVDILSSGKFNFKDLLGPVLFYICMVGINNSIWLVVEFSHGIVNPKIEKEIVLNTYGYVQRLSYSFFQNTQGGSISSKVSGILDGYAGLLNIMRTAVIQNFVGFASALTVVAIINIEMFFFSAVWSALYAVFIWRSGPTLSKLSRQAGFSRQKIYAQITDTITNILTLLNFANRKKELSNVKHKLETDYLLKLQKSQMSKTLYQFISGILTLVFFTFNLIFIVYLCNLGRVSPGDVVFVFLISMRFIDSIDRFTGSLQGLLWYIGDVNNHISILNNPTDPLDNPQGEKLQISNASIEFKNVDFQYDNDLEIFKNFNLTIKGGEKIGIIGSSGGGKTTMINILLKHFSISRGEVTIDGQNLYNMTSDSVREKIALIPQDIMLLHRTIEENIAYGGTSATTKEEIEVAAKKANIHEFINSLPEKYNTVVGERGVKLSGGQRQRIAIARAILKNAPIIILDEATSSLDRETEFQIQSSIDSMIKSSGATIIAIAHRTSTLRDMDRIVEISNGTVKRSGSFSEMCEPQSHHL